MMLKTVVILFLWNPKFHAELNPIEMKWAVMKDYTRKHTKESMAATKRGVEALKHYKYSTGERHCAHARRYMRAYMAGTPSDGVEAEMMQKTYTGHRTGSEGAVKIVLANSQQPMTAAEATSVEYIRNRAQWQAQYTGKRCKIVLPGYYNLKRGDCNNLVDCRRMLKRAS